MFKAIKEVNILREGQILIHQSVAPGLLNCLRPLFL